jgi:hypothetical protein
LIWRKKLIKKLPNLGNIRYEFISLLITLHSYNITSFTNDPTFALSGLILFLLAGINMDQCCQGAEISATNHKKGRKKYDGAGKIRAEFLAGCIKKGQKRGRTFLMISFS